MLVLLVAAVGLFAWAALIAAHITDWGNSAVVTNAGLACFAAAALAWWAR